MNKNPEKRDELYQTMVSELLLQPTVSFEALCRFATETLEPSVRYWCFCAGLTDQRWEEDLMQEIHVRLMLKAVSHFFLKDGSKEIALQKTREEFTAWIYRLAINCRKNFFRKLRGKGYNVLDIDDPDLPGIGYTDDYGEEREEQIRQLRQAFAVVLETEVNIYKTLTWLGMAVLMLDYDLTKIKANQKLLELFGDRTLGELYGGILRCAKRIPWLEISAGQDARIRRALQERDDDGQPMAEKSYHTFFMKQNGEVSGKKSVSDWENRMNGKVVDSFSPEEIERWRKTPKPDPFS